MKEAKEQDKKMKAEIYRDHINEMFSGADFRKEPMSSEYQKNFEHTKEMQKLCNNVNFDHHLLQNDLKWYSEAYLKSKSTIRK